MNSNLDDDQLCEIRDMLLKHPSFDSNYDDYTELLSDLVFQIPAGYYHGGWYLTNSDMSHLSSRHRSEIEAYLVNAMLTHLPVYTKLVNVIDNGHQMWQVVRPILSSDKDYTNDNTPKDYGIKPSPLEALYDFWLNY